jgi:hypothetical protein
MPGDADPSSPLTGLPQPLAGLAAATTTRRSVANWIGRQKGISPDPTLWVSSKLSFPGW